jgi:uncharacterized protein (UPF0262 family)
MTVNSASCPHASEAKQALLLPVLLDIRNYARFEADALEPPLDLSVSVVDNALHIEASDANGRQERFFVSLTPLRRLFKDYRIVCDAYHGAIAAADPRRVEAIDMGRRAFHNEGAEWLQERLGERLKGDRESYRYMFTLANILYL